MQAMPGKTTKLPLLLGALLLLAGMGLAAQTEISLSDHQLAAAHHGGDALDLGGNGQPEPGQHGHMVRVSGVPQVVEQPHDPDFNLQVPNTSLIRHVEMFQWREVNVAGQVHYEQDWVDHPLDSRQFATPAGHVNPDAFPLSGRRFDAGQVRVGNFRLSPVLLHALPGSVAVVPELSHMPSNLAASFSLHQGALVTCAKPDHPQLGDLRVSWEAPPAQTVTIYAQLDGDQLVPATNAVDGKGYDVQVGDRALVDVLGNEPPPAFLYTRRVVAVLLAALGVFLLYRQHRRFRGDTLWALALGALPVALVAAAILLGHGGVAVGQSWLGLALIALAIAIWRWCRSAREPLAK